MPPKKRKIEDLSSPSDADVADVEVKTERLSQEESKNKDTPQPAEGKPAASRNLRPRKSTCYAEKDSPEINFYEEKVKKIPRRKRRPASIEEGTEERDSKIKRTEKGNNDETASASSNNVEQAAASLEGDNIELAVTTLVSASNSEDPTSEKRNESSDGKEAAPAGTEAESSEPPKEKKRPKKKPKPKVAQSDVLPLPVDPNVVPKTEPVSPSTFTGSKETPDETASAEGKPVDSVVVKPKPKKRIRNKKPAVVPTTTDEDGKPVEQPVIKEEVEENDRTGKEITNGEPKEGATKVNQGDDQTKPPAPKRKPAKKKAKPKVKKDPETGTDLEKADGEAIKSSNNDENEDTSKEKKQIKTEVGTEETKNDTSNLVKKRVKSRPKKAVTSTKTTTSTINGESKPEDDSKTDNQQGEIKQKTDPDNEDGNEQSVTNAPAPPVRKPFFRGRRSKSISARSGRKEIVYTDEAIDPEDIRGFEHVEKYVTPASVRLPKFWDSEDEMSEDENNDNFRRIMCGFGTNCRIHEVIRPASEIVRRLKELQNTFGATKSLPLFQKDDLESIEDSLVSASAEPFFRKDRDRTITWHTDPSFFKYANNYPSKCK